MVVFAELKALFTPAKKDEKIFIELRKNKGNLDKNGLKSAKNGLFFGVLA